MEIETVNLEYEELTGTRRKAITLYLSVKFAEYLKSLYKNVNIQDYAFSYFVEDMLYWVTSDPKRLESFLNEFYEPVEPENIIPLDKIGDVDGNKEKE